jgi:hypothetical protein
MRVDRGSDRGITRRGGLLDSERAIERAEAQREGQ